MDYFIDDDHRIVCRAEIFNPEENKRITCYSLGYDAIGIAPRSWRLMDIYSPRIKFLRQLIRYVGILVTSISVPIILSSLS